MRTNKDCFNGLRVGMVAAILVLAASVNCWAAHLGHLLDGEEATAFSFRADDGYISTADGNSIYFWGYGLGTNVAQYPGPTMIVPQGATVTVTLTNTLPLPVSLVVQGHKVTATGGSAGLLTREAVSGQSVVTYTFTASRPGTYLYQTGTQPDLETEMGLFGALIVRPAGFNKTDTATWTGYGHPDTTFDEEYLFLLSEMDENIHDAVELQVQQGQPIQVDTTKWWPVYWFVNGRTGPDTVFPPYLSWMPHQPYDSMVMMHPGGKVLMRVIGGGRDPHPFHHHGNHAKVIARDGRLLESAPNAGPDLAPEGFTIPSTPGSTIDAIFSWTGKGLGWDAYGHTDPNQPLAPFEDPADHGKPFPVILPTDQDLVFGQMYGGSPFIGTAAALPPGQGGFNPSGGFMYMWHSHAEKELVNNNIFPGGMLTFVLIEAYPQH